MVVGLCAARGLVQQAPLYVSGYNAAFASTHDHTRQTEHGSMKLDVSDVLYDSSSVSSDSGTSQSSRVSHDFLSSIANPAMLSNNTLLSNVLSRELPIA
ncbi:hypothetical protein EAI_03398 [Harpegnathos saltator]|uniref:Uncharacterized protein n=1 Tax=Harpegnathos saltator TaxID=610380 RepID=E2BK03_HARSA|nr:hypothetical protein EAI_03398 [Harpegnathos saltator]